MIMSLIHYAYEDTVFYSMELMLHMKDLYRKWTQVLVIPNQENESVSYRTVTLYIRDHKGLYFLTNKY